MAYIFDEPSRTFSEYLLVPGYSSTECRVENVSLQTPVVKFKKGEESAIKMNIPLVSAIMQAVSGDELAIALAKEGGISFIYGSQSIENQAEMVRKVKAHKAGFVTSDANIRPDQTLGELLELKKRTGHSTTAVTEDGTPDGKMLGLVTSRDYRISRMSLDEKVCNFMTPFDKLIYAKKGVTLSEANNILWDNKLNALPIVDENQRLTHFVFRKDYDTHKAYPDELLDEHKRYVVGAGVNTRDYAERIPALVEAGADVLCIDSSEGFTEWQKLTLDFVREKYGDSVKIGAEMLWIKKVSNTWRMQVLTLSKSVLEAVLSVSRENRRALVVDRLPQLSKWLRQEMNIMKRQAYTFRSVPTAASYTITI